MQTPAQRAIACLTYDYVEHNGVDVTETSPVLQRSIAQDLREVEMGLGATGKTRLFAIAAAIDEAILELVEG